METEKNPPDRWCYSFFLGHKDPKSLSIYTRQILGQAFTLSNDADADRLFEIYPQTEEEFAVVRRELEDMNLKLYQVRRLPLEQWLERYRTRGEPVE